MREKWILDKHINDIDLIKYYALFLKSNRSGINKSDKQAMQSKLIKSEEYRPRLSDNKPPLDALNHKLMTLQFFMFGYKKQISNKNSKFMFSPLGNLYLEVVDNDKASAKVFATMLYAIQFPHPADKQSPSFELYPFRLIFKLLRDSRLDFKLFDVEVECILYFIQKVPNSDFYEKLVDQILKLRNTNNSLVKAMMEKDKFEFVTIAYEWGYYIRKIINDAGVIVQSSTNKNAPIICKLPHKKKGTSKSKPSYRHVYDLSFSLTETVAPLVDELLANYPFNDPVKKLTLIDYLKML